MFVVTTVGSSSAGGGGEERPLWSWDGVPSPLSITMVRMKVRGNRTRKPTTKNIALELGSNAEKWPVGDWSRDRCMGWRCSAESDLGFRAFGGRWGKGGCDGG